MSLLAVVLDAGGPQSGEPVTVYVDKSFALDAGFRTEISGPSDPWGKALVFSVGLRYFYETAAPDTQATQF